MNRTASYIRDRYQLWMGSTLLREYYDYSDFFNVGLWLTRTQNQREACENLMERLLTSVHTKQGTILDVACGMGATTRHLLKYYHPSAITAINICPQQLQQGRSNAPGCRFLLMDATNLQFEANSFDTIICVEAAFHFQTRRSFLQEAYRVLKPGGLLLLTDIIFASSSAAWQMMVPEENHVRDLPAYYAIYPQAGFHRISVSDLTDTCWEQFREHLQCWAQAKLLQGHISQYEFLGLIQNLRAHTASHYLLVSGEKP